MPNQELLDREEIAKEVESFKDFAFKKNMIEMSIAFILGGAFNQVITSVSQNLIMPIVNAILSHTGDSWRAATWQLSENIVIEYGQFLGSFIDFLITAIVLYIIFVKVVKRIWESYAKPKEEQPNVGVVIFPPSQRPQDSL